MLFKSLSFLSGVMLIMQLANLPNLTFLIVTLIIVFVVAVLRWFHRARKFRWLLDLIIFVLLGAIWAGLHARYYLDHKLAENLAGQEFVVEGVIRGIPMQDEHVQRFILEVTRFEINDKNIVLPERLCLSWYYGLVVNAG